jgi:UDPglucose--hexose-1-phosphate uridylyltransferase
MSVEEIRKVVDAWIAETEQIGSRPEINYVQVFENRGAIMGCSNPHPHCQIWATATLPNEQHSELESQREYLSDRGCCLLCDYLEIELRDRARIVCENESFVVLVPFWALWPFETLLLSKRHFASMPDCEERERTALADILKQITTRYDNLFEVSFPYSMGFHGAPSDGTPHSEWHFHAHYHPPLLRSATVRKFMVGYELLAQPQRDITPESAAERLRALPAPHYLSR